MTRLAYLALGFFAGVVITLSLLWHRPEPTPDTAWRDYEPVEAV